MSDIKIPEGFKKTDVEITFSLNEFEIFKKHILRLLLRDYYVFYSSKKYSCFYTICFYCKPSQESSLTYRLGCYNQTMLDFNTKDSIVNSDHVVDENYIESCLI